MKGLEARGPRRGISRGFARVHRGVGEGLVRPQPGDDVRPHACALTCDALIATCSLLVFYLHSQQNVPNPQERWEIDCIDHSSLTGAFGRLRECDMRLSLIHI